MLKRGFNRLKIKHKIALGYGAAIAVAVAGSTLGNEIGDYYLWRAWQEKDQVRQHSELLYRLQSEVLYLNGEKQALTALTLHSLKKDTAQVRQRLANIQSASLQLREICRALESAADELQIDPTDQNNLLKSQLSDFIQHHQAPLASYLRLLNTTLLQQNFAKPKQIRDALLTLNQSPATVSVSQMPEDLRPLIRLAEAGYEQAQQNYDRADIIRFQIAICGILLSLCLAILMAILTSQAIAHPLQAVTQVAQQVTQEGDFSRTIPVFSEDETGQLTRSFNQFIRRVQHLLVQQEAANTQLKTNNQELNHTLNTLKQTQAHMIQTEKMSGLGRMVAGISHEINNPVNFILGNLDHTEDYFTDLLSLIDAYQEQYPTPPKTIQTLLDEIDLDFLQEDFNSLLNSMRTGTNRINSVVESLRIFSRLDEVGTKHVDIHTALDSTLRLLTHRLQPVSHRTEIKVIKQYQDLPKVECHAGLINQVFMSILVNAIDALDTATEQTPSFTRTPTLKIQTQSLPDTVLIAITDNGFGIPETVQPRIFDPFFTTKPVGAGSGLGLSTSHQIVIDQHSGLLSCQSSPEATTFTIQLPISQPTHTKTA